MNSFTDAQPDFPYQSSEARRQLGLPEAPEIHLAVTALAEQLLSVAALAHVDPARRRISALRVASGAVLFGLPLLAAERELMQRLELPDVEGPDPVVWIHQGKDWLSEAVERLRAEGIAVADGFQCQRSNY